jgi:hypothetical protein
MTPDVRYLDPIRDRSPAAKWLDAHPLIRKGAVTVEMAVAALGPVPPDAELAAEQARRDELRRQREAKIPKGGPGTELTALAAAVVPVSACPRCKQLAHRIDLMGSKGCRAHFWEIVGALKDNAIRLKLVGPDAKPGLLARLGQVARVVASGPSLAVDPGDPFAVLVLTAIEAAEAKGY